jgi:hypothetical protein
MEQRRPPQSLRGNRWIWYIQYPRQNGNHQMGNHGQSQQILIILKATNIYHDPNLYHDPNPLFGNLKSQSLEKLRIHFKTIIDYWKQWEFHREKTLKSLKQFIGGWRSGREKAVGGNEGVREHDGPNDVF